VPGREQHLPPTARPAAPRELPGRGPAPLPGTPVGGPWPAREADAPGGRGPAVADPGPPTGAYDPFAFDDDEDDGPATVVGRSRGGVGVNGAAAAPRRDAGPPEPGLRTGAPPAGRPDPAARQGPPPEAAGGRRRAAARRATGAHRGGAGGTPVDGGPATQVDVTRARRDDGPSTEVGGRGGDGPATDVGARGDDGPATDVGGRGGAGPATDVGATGSRSGGRRRAQGRPGSGPRAGRSGRTGAIPAAAFVTSSPAPDRAAPGVAVPGRRAAARRAAEDPTALPGRGGLDDRPARRGRVDDERGAALPAGDVDLARVDEPVDPAAGLDTGRAADDLDLDDLDGRDVDDLDDLDDRDLDDPDGPASQPAQAWAGVVAQWLAGAVAGAVLWVLFRYLWRGLPVVALAAALLVTGGLVLMVRQLLHDVDRRTTVFAVLVGLLLTASPAVLVLLGR
jgi:hypothetical protein